MAKSPIEQKIDRAIELIRKAEQLSLSYDGRGYLIGFSGGKDSQCVYHLAQMDGVKFEAVLNRTTIEPIEVIKFTKQHYPDVDIRFPHDRDGRPINFYSVMRKTGLPSRHSRWCCAQFKELEGKNRVVITGVRAAESSRRAAQNPTPMKAFGRKTRMNAESNTGHSTTTETSHGIIKHIDLFDIDKEMLVDCAYGADKVLLQPIFDWTDDDVWTFLNDIARVPHCSLYDTGAKRIGCIMCPMASSKQRMREREQYPQIYNAIKTNVAKSPMIERMKFGNVDELLDWWMSDMSQAQYFAKKRQLNLFEND